ncbi:863_t:CDS:2 [Cetraspora pellucida]|uniref:863_t:CDS:1 n=1 Tax=Cetraspora pellucida TaxID=1433469 RepID=A0ACA9KMA3_9GLOM|nr:863_t:CDS:2 [Cetraspora pellucida]
MAEKNLNDEKIKQLRIEYNPQQNDKTSGTKTILLIGSSGRGKSTLANVITGIENKFKESGASVIGIGDTKLKKEEVLDKTAEAVYLAKDGISQVFFVISKKFDQSEMANFNLLKAIIFDQEVVNHTTIVRTRFEKFKDPEKCQEDIDSMVGGGNKLSEIIESCQRRVIYVDNPSLNLVSDKNENEVGKKEREAKIENRKEARVDSQDQKIEDSENESEKSFRKKGKEIENNQQELENEKSNLIITTLENELKELAETKKLIEEIQKTEGFIRQKVFNHIFNNIKDITEVDGGDAFIDSIVGDNSSLSANKLTITELQKQREELEEKLLEKKDNDQSLEEIKIKIKEKEKELLEPKKELLTIKEIAEE